MKIIWDLDKLVAIPKSNIKEFEICNIDKWSKEAKAKWQGSRYYVIARYTICTGDFKSVFTSDSKEDCITFIENALE